MLHGRIKAVVPYPVMGVPETIDTYPDGVGIGPQRKGAIGGNADTQKQRSRHFHHVMNGMLPVLPEKRLTPFKNQYPDTLPVQFQQQRLYLAKGEG